jgi:hypothetical protein
LAICSTDVHRGSLIAMAMCMESGPCAIKEAIYGRAPVLRGVVELRTDEACTTRWKTGTGSSNDIRVIARIWYRYEFWGKYTHTAGAAKRGS